MKRLLCVVVLFASVFSAKAQDETLFENQLVSGGFGGPAVRFSSVKGEFGVLAGGYGGWLVNHSFLIGGGGYALASDIRANKEAEDLYSNLGRPLYLNLGYGGGVLEYIITPSNLTHIYVSTLIGAGTVSYRRNPFEDEWNWDPSQNSSLHDAFFVLEPGVFVELNITSWFRLSGGGTYRFVSGIDRLVGVSNTDLSGASGGITLKFGSF